MPNRYTYSEPHLSLWQSAVAEVHRRRVSVEHRTAMVTLRRKPRRPLLAEEDLMAPVHLLGMPITAKQPIVPERLFAAPSGIAPRTVGGVVVDCAKIAAEFLWAEITGNHAKSEELAGELKDSVCDVGWGECVTTYLAFKASGGQLPYRANLNPVFDLGPRTKLAIVGDWGTGDEVAINVLQQVAALQPDVLLHLGDVYYAGTQSEEQSNFLDICREVLGSGILLFSLCGNHDMYSGGQGYYWLVDQLSQQASYFCLQNDAWQFLAMDTGHNDNNPFDVATNMTSVNAGEVNWLLSKISSTGGPRTVLLSHHQLFSPFGSVGSVNGQAQAYNPNLFTSFQSIVGKIVLWFWGHEHTLAVYDPYMGLQRGRCIGASAVPVFTAQQSYTTASGLATFNNLPLPTWNPQGIVGNNGTDYFHCFAFMTLTGTAAQVDYYQVPILGAAQKLPVSDQV